MLYSSPNDDPSKVGAHWDIWPASSIPALSKAIVPEATDEECRLASPIVAEMAYVEPSKLPEGESPWVIEQQPGEAVIIPPGCPHQVTTSFNSFVKR
jgi:hypothetical protein